MITPAEGEALLRRLLRAGDGTPELVVASGDVAGVRAALEPLNGIADLTADRVSVNVDRVDVELSAASDQWRVVLFVDPAGLVESAHSWHRPPRFDGVAGGRAIVINGPSGAGKSSLMQAVLDADPRPWVVFDEPWLGTVRQPYLIWADAAPTLQQGFLEGISSLAAAGNLVLLSAAGSSFAAVEKTFQGVPTLIVGLHCSIDTLLERERGREGRWGGLAEASLGSLDGWRHDLMLDTTDTAPAELAQVVLDAVHDRKADATTARTHRRATMQRCDDAGAPGPAGTGE